MAKRIIRSEALEEALEQHRQATFEATAATVRAVVTESGLTQRQIAERMNTVSHNALLKAMQPGNLQLSTLADIAFALGRRIKVVIE